MKSKRLGSGTEAAWLPFDCSYDEAIRLPQAAFMQPPLHALRRLVMIQALAHPLSVIRMRRGGASLAEIGRLLAWRDTAEFFDIDRLVTPDGSPVRGAAGMKRRARSHRPPRTVSKRPAITGVLIAQNEEATIAAALTSLRPFVDELIVLDGGSADDTCAVAESVGATVHHRPFEADFSAQRNALLELVHTPWVFSLDCDERLTEQLGELVHQMLRGTRADAILVPRHNLVGDEAHPFGWPDMQARVYRTNLRWSGRVHEQLHFRRPLFTPANGPYIEHIKSLSQARSRWMRYIDLDPQISPAAAAAYREDFIRHQQGEEV